MSEIFSYLDKLFPNPECELHFTKDYELVIAVMLSAQSTDKRVNMVTDVLFKKYPNLYSLKEANISDLEVIIKSVGTYHKKADNIKKIATILEPLGYVPNDRKLLESLPGVGRKTTNVVLGILYNVPCIAVDTHVKRVSIRLGLAKKNDNILKIEEKLTKKIPENQRLKMHHQLVLFGRYYCKAKNPNCKNCKLINMCKEKQK